MATISYYDMMNLTAPANGITHSVKWVSNLPGGADSYNMTGIQNSYGQFVAQGVKINCTNTTGGVSFNQNGGEGFYVDAGNVLYVMLEALNTQEFFITGNAGDTPVITFYDFPIFPFLINTPSSSSIQQVSITNTPIAVTPPATPLLYAQTYVAVTATGATTLRTSAAAELITKIKISLTPNAIQTTAGLITLTLTANGVVIFEDNIYVPSAVGTSPSDIYSETLEFDSFNVSLPNASLLTATLSVALTGGQFNINTYTIV